MSTYDGLWPLCETCGAVPTSHRDYRDCEAHMQVVAQAYNAGRENGGRLERVAVVTFLRETLATSETAYASDDLDYAIDIIERGEHRREEKE